MGKLKAFNVEEWMRVNSHLLKPPINNHVIHCGDFQVMLVSGPNSRSDYHVDAYEEYFYQIRGRLILKVYHENEFYDVVINGGDTFCLPAMIAHSPQRENGSLGIVVERRREKGVKDCLKWFCGECREVVWEKWFWCGDLVGDLKRVVEEYWGDVSNRRCRNCGWVETKEE